MSTALAELDALRAERDQLSRRVAELQAERDNWRAQASYER
jgi:uncharacterized coiled-coil DUF342 family protein